MYRKLNFATLCLHVRKSIKHVRKAIKALCENISKPPFSKRIFLEKDFCSFENSLLGYSRSLFQKESPKGQCQFLCFWKPISKDYSFIKSPKGKTLIDPSGVTSLSTPGLDWNKAEKPPPSSRALIQPPAVVQLLHARGPIRGPLTEYGVCCVLRAELRVLSLSGEEGRSTFGIMQESGPNFKGLPKVSGVATNHWVFLRCDWSPVSSWFYYRS